MMMITMIDLLIFW